MTLHTGRRQTGSTLIVSMIMLVLLTLFVLSAINSSTVNLRISSNTQTQDEARAAAQRALEAYVSVYANFYPTPTAQNTTVSVNNDTTGNYAVSITAPICKRAAKQAPARTPSCASGEVAGVYCIDTLWEVSATASATATGVSRTITQGVSITFPPDSVPPNCSI